MGMAMRTDDLRIPGLKLISPRIFPDSRGYFMEIYHREKFRAAGIDAEFVQDNESSSSYGVIRGLHLQLPPHTQAKLIRVLSGRILDVVVDLRCGSPTFGEHLAIELDDVSRCQLFVPHGLAHGFAVLSETARIAYKCDQFYCPAAERSIRPDDPALGIDWKIPRDRMILSPKDEQGVLFENSKEFHFQKT